MDFKKHDFLNPFFTKKIAMVSTSFELKKQPFEVFYKKSVLKISLNS